MRRSFAGHVLVRTPVLAAALATALAALSGCATGAKSLPALQSASSLASQNSFTAPAAQWPAEQWWKAYGDSQLDSLIEEALADGPSLKAATARVAKAQALARVSGGARFPSLNAEASASSAKQSLNNGFPDEFKAFLPQGWQDQGRVALTAQYELDFFGRNHAAFAAATSQADAAAAEAASARLQLSSAVALAYADFARLTADRAAAESTLRLREDSGGLVRQRFQAGLEHEGQVSQSDSETAGARADLAALDGEIAQARNQIAALLGKGPDRGASIAAPAAPTLSPPGLPANLSADLIGRRPDLAAARARAAAAAQRVNVARANFYPNINLTALIGYQALPLDLLTDKDSQFGSVGPAINLPIFNGGRIKGEYLGARADYDEAAALYSETLANALRDVADALAVRRATETELTLSQTALDAAENSYRIERLRYDGGLAAYLDVLTVENSLVARRRALAGMRARAFAADVTLIRALGGGYVAANDSQGEP
jgi:NodT family efflux transporter outer membrane factor (OMF) lipoprotein